MPNITKFIIDAPCMNLPVQHGSEVFRAVSSNDPSGLARILFNIRCMSRLSIVMAYSDLVADPFGMAIFGTFLVDLYHGVDGYVIRSFWSHSEILRVFGESLQTLVQWGKIYDAQEACLHNIKVLFGAIEAAREPGYRENSVVIGVCAPISQDLCRYTHAQICCGIEQFVEDYFRRHPSKFPMGEFNELLVLSSL